MLLFLNAYTNPFRAILLEKDAEPRIIGGTGNQPDAHGYFPLPVDRLVDALLLMDIHPRQIEHVVINGKPLLFFENFLHDCMLFPTPRKLVRFAQGIPFFLMNILRVRRRIEERFKCIPEFHFINSVDALVMLPEIFPEHEEFITWNSRNEFGSPIRVNAIKQKIEVLRNLNGALRKFEKIIPLEQRREILRQAVHDLKAKARLWFIDPGNGAETLDDPQVSLCLDAPTIGLLCSALYFMQKKPEYSYHMNTLQGAIREILADSVSCMPNGGRCWDLSDLCGLI